MATEPRPNAQLLGSTEILATRRALHPEALPRWHTKTQRLEHNSR